MTEGTKIHKCNGVLINGDLLVRSWKHKEEIAKWLNEAPQFSRATKQLFCHLKGLEVRWESLWKL